MVVTRPLRGSRLSSFYPPIPDDVKPSLSDFDSAFQLQEYINVLIRQNPHDVETIVAPPGRVKKGDQDEKDTDAKGDGVDEACWIYEQLRRLAQDLTHPLITSLQQECTRTSCPEMKAGEWLYLCVAHGNDGAMEQCCAIDYIIHTLDSATALLNSPRAFPSRISIPQPSIRHFSSLARRLGRIFSHAYFHHREVFESSEAENSLYARFLALTARFDLVPPDFLVIPPRATNNDASSSATGDTEPPRLLAAALHPQPQTVNEKERGNLGIMESPRKGGRNRTDTMVFSDAEAFTEALRGQAGSPPSFSLAKDSTSISPPRSSGFDIGGIPPVDSLQVLAQSGEACLPHTLPAENDNKEGEKGEQKEEEQENRPYTLTFSASGTMKTALPPGVSPSSSGASGLGLAPSPLQVPSNNNNIGTADLQQAGNNLTNGASQFPGFSSLHPPAYTSSRPFGEPEDIEYKEGENTASGPLAPEQRSAEMYFSGKLDEILPLRKSVLEGRMADVELRDAEGDNKDGDDDDGGGVVDEVAALDKAIESDDAKREEEGEFVVISAESDKPAGPEPDQSHDDGTTQESEPAPESAPKSLEEDKADESNSPFSVDADKAAEPEEKTQDADTSLETDLADVEKVLHE